MLERGVRGQLALPFDEPDQFAAVDFIAALSNEAARTALKDPFAWVNGRLVLWGETGCGKTHLARIWAAERNADIIMAPRLLVPYSSSGTAVLIEDIDILAEPIALLATLERATSARTIVLLTSRTPPARLALEPADLASRLRASLTIRIDPPEPALLDAMLVKLTSTRQITLPDGLGAYLLARLPRQPAVLREAVARLDRYSLALGTAPSRLIADRLLAELAELPDNDAPQAHKLWPDEKPGATTPSML